jgi:hypothetical protein
MMERARALASMFVCSALWIAGCGAKREPPPAMRGPGGSGAAGEGSAGLPIPPPVVPFPPCAASASWVTAPNPPTEIGGTGVPVGDETFCQFYQFAEQWFLALVSPSSTAGSRVFETFNVVGSSGSTDCPTAGGARRGGARLVGKEALRRTLFARVNKPQTADFDPVLPADLNQAMTNKGQYDQKGNVVLYAVLYNSTECQATAAGFAPNTIEVKTSWRILQAADPTYFTMNAIVDFGQGKGPQNLLLGLVGFHLVINTALHPEFVWATFEHKANDPDCTAPAPAPGGAWSFTSAAAAQCLAQYGLDGCGSFNFNTGATATSPTGTPTQTCRTYRDGTDTVPIPPAAPAYDSKDALNIFTIDTLNAQLVGPGGILTSLPATNPMAVFANYSLQGALWTNAGLASDPVNQRGSLELVNTTMETFVQKAPPANNANCFGCHTYDPSNPLEVSHIYQGAPTKAAALKRRAAAGKK